MREKPPKNAFILVVKKVMERNFTFKIKKGLSLRKVCNRRNRYNYMKKRSIEIKNHGHKKARAEKLKGQCNENFLFVEWLTMRHVSRIWSNMFKCGGETKV
jgi:hypothetical protein